MYVKKCPLQTDKANTALLHIFYASLLELKKTYEGDQERFLTEMSKLVSKLARDFGLISSLAEHEGEGLTDKERKQFMDWYYYQSPVFQDKLETPSQDPVLREIFKSLYEKSSNYTTYKRMHTEFIKECCSLYEDAKPENKKKKNIFQRIIGLVVKDR